ncbi:MAG: ERF family protein [Methanobrevibacter sp.]|nr:ERF family protein [Methanobrevibacter sp.]
MENKKMNIYEKLLKVQMELKAPKGQYNNFGKYKYRSCEDILESVKPILQKNKLSMQMSDELVQVGDRYYIKATATLLDIEDNSTMSNTAYAREDFDKKGMDGSQITGTASSYARKYALNGLFLIDDTKDADTNEYRNEVEDTEHLMLINQFNELAEETNLNRDALYKKLGVSSNAEIGNDKLKELIETMKKKLGGK